MYGLNSLWSVLYMFNNSAKNDVQQIVEVLFLELK